MDNAKSSFEILFAFACQIMQAWVPDFPVVNLFRQAFSNPTSRITI